MCLEEGRWVGVKKARGLIRIRLLSIRTLGIQMDQMVFFMMSMHGYRQDGGMGGWYKSWTRQFFEKKKKEKKGENIIYILKVGLLFHFYVKCLKICNVA
jgi:hypothetical protein